MSAIDGAVLSVEYFAAKGRAGMMMAVPPRCGLRQADTLRIDGLTMEALYEESILPIDLPILSDVVREKLVGLSNRGKQLPVGEFVARGLFDCYFLDVTVIG